MLDLATERLILGMMMVREADRGKGEPEPTVTSHEKIISEVFRQTRLICDIMNPLRNERSALAEEAVLAGVEAAVTNRQALLNLLSLRRHDSYTYRHSLNVCALSLLIGTRLGLREGEMAALATGALLHDLGKIMLPPALLNKRGPLTSYEWQLIRRHGEIAYIILRRQTGLPVIAAHIAHQHHENFDGSGYPRGLAGTAIHRCARIVALADAFDALTADRPYREAFPLEEACRFICRERGSKLDPDIVDIFAATWLHGMSTASKNGNFPLTGQDKLC